ncbi:MAG: aspartate kinase [Christensenellaceae bacterium]|nr:aspartate kinase [Christensenellaceae bacterium]
MIKVAKFGGTSLADASQFKKVRDILLSDSTRHFMVPSAPGRRFPGDTKVTDLLYHFYADVKANGNGDEAFGLIKERFIGIRDELGLNFDIESELDTIYENVNNGSSEDYVASRGEYLNGLLMANYLGWDFVDPESLIVFDKRGRYNNNATHILSARRLKEHDYAVIPGFYGSMPDGSIKTFSRGGSDITGAIIAAATDADLYENWTDVDGFLMADPRIVKDPGHIEKITYRELRELSYMGASVLHEDAIFPVYNAAIPINVRNTNFPDHCGTMILPIVEDEDDVKDDISITGVAGKKNFTVISIEKNGMNAELGFGRKVLACVEKYGLPFEHMPSGIDTLCVVVDSSKVKGALNDIVDDIHRVCEPDSVEIIGELALIATVGRKMVRSVGCAAKLFTTLAEAHVNIRMIDQGSSELNIIVGVDNKDFEKAITAIHDAFVKR